MIKAINYSRRALPLTSLIKTFTPFFMVPRRYIMIKAIFHAVRIALAKHFMAPQILKKLAWPVFYKLSTSLC